MKLKKMVQLSLLTTIALTIFVIESYLPPLAPIYGVKLGLANIITLLAVMLWGWKEALIVFLLRVFLGSVFTGQMAALLYSLAGGGMALFIMVLGKRLLGEKLTWFISALGGIFHNIGQIIVACYLLNSLAVMIYFPLLLISGIITGIFTGVAAQVLILKNIQIRNLFQVKE